MDIKDLFKQCAVVDQNNAEESQPRTKGKRPINKFTAADTEWLVMYSTQCTATEAAAKLGRDVCVIRKKCLSLGLQLKYSDKMANNTKPGEQKHLRVPA